VSNVAPNPFAERPNEHPELLGREIAKYQRMLRDVRIEKP
jgi:hypothetical protein